MQPVLNNGSTKQFQHDRIAQHHSSKESVMYEHNKNHNNTAKFSCKILAQAANVKELLFKEGLLIKKLCPKLNQKFEQDDVVRFLTF